MSPTLGRTAAAILVTLSFMLLVAPAVANAPDLSTRANIFTFPQPMAVGNLVLKSLSGKSVSLGDFKGRVVLLRFTSVHCPACRMEEPLLVDLQRKFGPAGLEIVGVNLVDSPQDIASHVAASKTPYPILFDGGGGFKLKVVDLGGKKTAFVLNPAQEAIFEVPGFPTTYILDCSGLAVGYSVGPARWNDSAATSLIQKLVTDPKACFPRAARGMIGR